MATECVCTFWVCLWVAMAVGSVYRGKELISQAWKIRVRGTFALLRAGISLLGCLIDTNMCKNDLGWFYCPLVTARCAVRIKLTVQ